MNIEPTPAEYDSLGTAVLSRVRRRERLRRSMQLAVVGLSAAALAVLVTVNIGNFGVEHFDFPSTAAGEGSPVRHTVTCYASASLDAESVTLMGAFAVTMKQSAGQAILECEKVWSAGLLGPALTLQSAVGPQAASQPSRVQEMLSSTLHPCVLSSGAVAVLPISEAPSPDAEKLCKLLETKSQVPDTP